MQKRFNIPDQVVKKTEKVTQNLLLKKSRDTYDKDLCLEVDPLLVLTVYVIWIAYMN